MAKPRNRRVLDSYFIRALKETITPGDTVLMRPVERKGMSYVAKIEKIESNESGGHVKVQVRWYYRPEEAIGGRRQFHGSKELFFSDHRDIQSVGSIEGKCHVHSFKAYTKLESVGLEDFFCRFDYNAKTGSFSPDRVAVYCKCEMPYNPDDLMVLCEGCSDWFHPGCIGMSDEEAKRIEHFYCETCLSENLQGPPKSSATSRFPDMKVDTKRRRM